MPIGIYPRTKEQIERATEQIMKCVEANKGRKQSKETIRKRSIAMKGKNKGEKHGRWKGGRITTSQGYIAVLKPEHPSADKYGYVYEHRLVMEKHLDRYLKKGEIVHHIDDNRANNLIDNLVLFPTGGAHRKYHIELRRKQGRPIGRPIGSKDKKKRRKIGEYK